MLKKIIAVMLIAVLALCFAGCGASTSTATEAAIPSATTSTYDEVVNYFISKGFISKDATPVEIMENGANYFTDNTNGEWTDWNCADEARDYNGLYLFFWNGADSEYYEGVYQSIAVNGNMILLGGGAAMMQAAGVKGNYAIAFSADYADQEGALAAFNAMAD